MKFKVSKTFEETTPESRTEGVHSDHGFIFEDQVYTLSELKTLIKDGAFFRERGTNWYMSEWTNEFDGLGTDRTENLHIELIK